MESMAERRDPINGGGNGRPLRGTGAGTILCVRTPRALVVYVTLYLNTESGYHQGTEYLHAQDGSCSCPSCCSTVASTVGWISTLSCVFHQISVSCAARSNCIKIIVCLDNRFLTLTFIAVNSIDNANRAKHWQVDPRGVGFI